MLPRPEGPCDIYAAGGGRGGGGASITVTKPLKLAHAEGAQVGSYGPTPGAPNQFARRTQ